MQQEKYRRRLPTRYAAVPRALTVQARTNVLAYTFNLSSETKRRGEGN